MKKKCWLLLTILLCLLALTGCRVDESGFEAFQTSLLDDYRSGTTVKIQPEDSDIANFRLVLENEKWELYYNETTAEIACKDKQTGKLFRSNNAQWGQDQEGAQLLIDLANEQGTQYAWNSLTDAAAYGQVQYEQMQDAFEVTYLFGKAAQVYVVPEVLTVEAFESILDRVESTGDKNTLKRLFTYLELKDSDLPQTREKLLERFSVLEKMPVYALSGNPSKLEMNKLEKIFASIGYTMEQKLADEAACEYVPEDADELHAAITLRYTLTDAGLRVEIPFDKIAVSEGDKLVQVTLLPYFGAPGAQERGYAVIPDGCGALMDLQTVRDNGYPAYSARVYGTDDANQVTDRAASQPVVALPVFGVNAGEQAVAATIVQGAPFATIVADAPRSDGKLGYAGVQFMYMETAYYSLDSNPENRILCYQPRANNCDMAVEYTLLTEKTDYNAIALAMKQSLTAIGLLKGTASGQLPLVLETIGAIDVEELLLGVPVTQIRPLTTFEQTTNMALSLSEEAKGLRVILSGAMSGGVRTARQLSIAPEAALGGMEGFTELRDTLQAQGIPLAVSNETMYVYKDNWFDGFDANDDTARLLTSVAAYRPDYTLSTMHMTSEGMSAYMLNQDAILEGIQSFDQAAQQLKLDAMALPGVGDSLYSDMRASDFVNRDDMRSALQSAMESLTTDAWLRRGNAYALPGATMIYDVPLHASAHPLLSQEIPLTQMILSGHVDYAATSMQYAADEQDYLLRCIGFGSGLYAQTYAANGEAVKYTDFDSMYAGSWDLTADNLQAAYAAANDVLQDVAGKAIVHYSQQGQITRTLYENGIAIYVNNSAEPESFVLPDQTQVQLAGYSWTSIQEAVE